MLERDLQLGRLPCDEMIKSLSSKSGGVQLKSVHLNEQVSARPRKPVALTPFREQPMPRSSPSVSGVPKAHSSHHRHFKRIVLRIDIS